MAGGGGIPDPKTVEEAFAALDSPNSKSKSQPMSSGQSNGATAESTSPAVPKSSGTSKTSNKPTEKRQMTLEGMFSKGGASKKPRLDGPADSSSPAAKASVSKTIISSTTLGALNGSSPQRLSSIPFNTAKWAATLPTETRDLLALETNSSYGIGHTYLKVLHTELTKPYFLDLKRFLAGEGVVGDGTAEPTGKGKVYPPMRDIYTWSRRTPLDKVKVVIIGQDPYHGPNQAHGLCFSVRPGVTIPGSLRNIYTELKNEYPTSFEAPKHGSLLSWSASGVLLLNTSLTVRPGQAGSHANKGWEQFTDAVVKVVDRYGGGDGRGMGVVFLCWGAWAAKRVAGLSKTKHLVLQSAHPSPLSAHRGFLGNGHFKAANVWLREKYGDQAEVDWTTLLPDGPPPKPAPAE